VYVPFWPPRARKTAETARFGPSAGKTESTAATPPKFASFYPLEFFGLIHKRPGYDPFFAENPFSPADEFVFMGLVVRSCHFDVTACAKGRRLDKLSIQIYKSVNKRFSLLDSRLQQFFCTACSQLLPQKMSTRLTLSLSTTTTTNFHFLHKKITFTLKKWFLHELDHSSYPRR